MEDGKGERPPLDLTTQTFLPPVLNTLSHTPLSIPASLMPLPRAGGLCLKKRNKHRQLKGFTYLLEILHN